MASLLTLGRPRRENLSVGREAEGVPSQASGNPRVHQGGAAQKCAAWKPHPGSGGRPKAAEEDAQSPNFPAKAWGVGGAFLPKPSPRADISIDQRI